jgi:hypothetical protein
VLVLVVEEVLVAVPVFDEVRVAEKDLEAVFDKLRERVGVLVLVELCVADSVDERLSLAVPLPVLVSLALRVLVPE